MGHTRIHSAGKSFRAKRLTDSPLVPLSQDGPAYMRSLLGSSLDHNLQITTLKSYHPQVNRFHFTRKTNFIAPEECTKIRSENTSQ